MVAGVIDLRPTGGSCERSSPVRLRRPEVDGYLEGWRFFETSRASHPKRRPRSGRSRGISPAWVERIIRKSCGNARIGCFVGGGTDPSAALGDHGGWKRIGVSGAGGRSTPSPGGHRLQVDGLMRNRVPYRVSLAGTRDAIARLPKQNRPGPMLDPGR